MNPKEWRKEQKQKFLAHVGVPVCSKCKYTSDTLTHFDFHHVFPESKSFNISKMLGRYKFDTWKSELNKCVLVCKHCHASIHDSV